MKTSDSSHPNRIRTTAVAAAALGVLGVLALAACGSSSSKASGSSGGTSTPSASTSLGSSATLGSGNGAAGGSSSASSSASTSASSSGGKAPTSTAPSTGSGRPADCTAASLKLSVSPVREPINHVLITATNTAQKPCRLNAYPFLKYDPDQQSPVKAADATKPAATVVLEPGASAYAGVMTSAADGSGKNGKDRPTITLQLAGLDGGGLPGAASTLAMPKDAQFVDDSVVVSYWVTDRQTALY